LYFVAQPEPRLLEEEKVPLAVAELVGFVVEVELTIDRIERSRLQIAQFEHKPRATLLQTSFLCVLKNIATPRKSKRETVREDGEDV
jgi:hypothetical protein